MAANEPVLVAKGISKRFAGVQALDQVDLTLKRGTITALIGENGAGKSTLVKILSGFYKADSGEISVDGRDVDIRDVQHSTDLGISVIHQIPSFAPDMSVVDNIFLGKELTYTNNRLPLPRFDIKKEAARILPLIDQYGGDFTPYDRLDTLKAYQQRLVGILKALVFSARILILDEPTAALPLEERELLLSRIIRLKDEGYSILYVSHHFDEIEKVADEIVALRDGILAGYSETVPNQSRMIEMMTGYPLDDITEIYDSEETSDLVTPDAGDAAGHHRFRLTPPSLEDSETIVNEALEFTFRNGEITVLSGMVGSGAKDAAEAMFGMQKKWNVEYSTEGKRQNISSPSVAISRGIGYLSDDRIGASMIPDFSVRKNLSIPRLKKVANWWGHIADKREWRIANDLCGKMTVKMSSLEQGIADLSGGNQQKVMLARWLFSEVDLLILNEPTQGIDVKAKQDVISLLHNFIAQGGACLIVTNDPEEFLHQAHRIIVMQRGTVSGDFQGTEIQREEVLKSMLIHK